MSPASPWSARRSASATCCATAPGCRDAITVGTSAGGLILAGAVLSQNPWRSVDGYVGHSAGVQLLALISVGALARVGSIGGVPQLNTVRGAIDTADLGVTLMHEHVFMLITRDRRRTTPRRGATKRKREADAIDRLNELKSRGVDSIVDLTVIGLGRYIPRIARIAAATDINIVVATGLYTYNDVPMYLLTAAVRARCSTARRS